MKTGRKPGPHLFHILDIGRTGSMQLSAEHQKGTPINDELGRAPALLKVRKVTFRSL
jgi:hypothetical protein